MSDEKPSDGSAEVDEIVARLEERERARKRNVVIKTAMILIPAFAAIVFAWMYRETVLAPDLDIEGGEKEVLAETNDPQCRELISLVTAIGTDYKAAAKSLEENITSQNADDVRDARLQLDGFRSRLADASSLSEAANLRFDESREEIETWFKYVDNELRLLDVLAQENLAKLEPEQAAETDEPPSTKTSQERLDGALLASDDAFENFRVWHTSSLHPCGMADADEEAWTPEKALDAPTANAANAAKN